MSCDDVDLLVPMFNAERFLERLKCQIDDLEPRFQNVIVWDDASRDRSAERAEAIGLSVFLGETNLGPGGARNRLAKVSTAKWVHFHDVDDEIVPDYLARVLPLLSDEVDVLLHDVEFVDEATRAPEIVFRAQPDIEVDPIRSLLTHPMGSTSSVIRRDLFVRIGGFDESCRCFEDGDLHLRLALAGARFRRLSEVLSTSLRHSDGASSNMSYCHKCRLEFLERYIEMLPTRLMDDLSAEFLKTAYELMGHGEKALARRAIEQCRNIGGRFPRTSSPVLKLISDWLPDLAILRLQGWFREVVSRLTRIRAPYR